MSNEPIYLTTPVGRFVMGDAFNGSDKDMQGRPKFDKTGKPKMQWFMGLAIRKDDPGWSEFWQQIAAVAQRDFPAGQFNTPGFAWKIVDGDGTNQEGKTYPEHCHGCYIVRMSSGFAPTIYNAQNQQIVDPTQCKRGDYIRAYVAIRGNDDMQKPGVYISHSMVQVAGFGEAINTGPSPDQAFGAPAALPAGASTTPVAPTGGMPAAPGPAAPAAPSAPELPGTASPGNAPAPPAYPPILNGPTG